MNFADLERHSCCGQRPSFGGGGRAGPITDCPLDRLERAKVVRCKRQRSFEMDNKADGRMPPERRGRGAGWGNRGNSGAGGGKFARRARRPRFWTNAPPSAKVHSRGTLGGYRESDVSRLAGPFAYSGRIHPTTTPTNTSDRSVCRFGDMCKSAQCPWHHPTASGTTRQPQWDAGSDMLPPRRRAPEAVSMPAEKERARNWEEHMQQNSWAQGRPTHGSETSPNRTHSKTQGNHEVRALQQPPNAAQAERAISKHPRSLYKVPTYSTRPGAAPCVPGGARHGGGNRAVNSQPRMGQSTLYGDVKSSYGGAGEWDRRGCATWAPSSATRQGEEQHRHTKRGSHTKGDTGGHTSQGGGAQQGRRGYQNGGKRMVERTHGRQRQQRGWLGQPAPSLPGARATPAQPASGGGCLLQPRWAVCATGVGAHQGQTSREGEKDIWWTAGTARGETGHLGRTETQRGRLWTACGQRCVDSKNSQTTPATTSTSYIRQLLGAADAQTAHHATSSTAPTHQLLGSANAETTPARAPAAAANRTQQPDATCEGKNG